MGDGNVVRTGYTSDLGQTEWHSPLRRPTSKQLDRGNDESSNHLPLDDAAYIHPNPCLESTRCSFFMRLSTVKSLLQHVEEHNEVSE